ncbi:MAG TPA: hypothetical protein VMU89_17455 [Thermomicrobiaceae bacterium]|nr:hypothetical protein [Thermomicrobiaceae bacterium]
MRTRHRYVDRNRLLALIPDDLSLARADELVAQCVEPRPHGYGSDRAVLRRRGVSVWVVIADLDATNGDLQQAADDFDLQPDEVLAAVLYYRQVPDLIEARILLNDPSAAA